MSVPVVFSSSFVAKVSVESGIIGNMVNSLLCSKKGIHFTDSTVKASLKDSAMQFTIKPDSDSPSKCILGLERLS